VALPATLDVPLNLVQHASVKVHSDGTGDIALALPPEQRQKPIYVISSDTLVETPVIVRYIDVTLERIEKARQEITEFRTDRRAEANTEYQRLIAVSRQQAEAKVSAALAEMHQDAEAARKVLAASADALATDIAQQALGRPLEA
jgi:vacuolar-type H+-ATPase subunit H